MLNLESMLPGALFFFAGLIVLWRSWSRKKVIDLLVLKNREELKLVQHQIEAEKRDASIKIKDEIYKRRQELEIDIKRERLELERLQSRLQQKTSDIETKEEDLDKLADQLNMKERELERQKDLVRLAESRVKTLNIELASKLEKISNMSQTEARKILQDTLRDEVHHSAQKWITKVEQESRETAKERSIEMLVTAMQRYTAEQVTLHSSAVVHLPNEEMKGRIIGKEGRNIKALEMATGMEFVIADAPETITISGFNPIRREVARQTLEKLIADGRINSTRIEETVLQVEKELDDFIQEKGKNIILELNLQGIHPELITLLGKLYFRTSFSQNVLQHSKEVAIFGRMIAEELGLDGQIAMRAGLLHDIGKAVTAEVEGPHAMIGADIAKRCGEDQVVVNAIAAHHQEVPFTSVYAPIIVIADTISAARPGARREIFSTYVKRMEKLEEIASSFSGIKKVYALQAGREVRIIVEENVLDDDASLQLARDIAKKIEAEMAFPGQIKINVIREKRSIEYAK